MIYILWVSLQAFSLHYASGKPDAMEQALKKLCEDVKKAVRNGLEIVVLSDRISKDEMGISRPPISTLLAVGAVHHHLIRYNSSRMSLLQTIGFLLHPCPLYWEGITFYPLRVKGLCFTTLSG